MANVGWCRSHLALDNYMTKQVLRTLNANFKCLLASTVPLQQREEPDLPKMADSEYFVWRRVTHFLPDDDGVNRPKRLGKRKTPGRKLLAYGSFQLGG
jgi:hypothetical protein